MPSLNIRRNDLVEVIAGSDKGKRGRVLRVLPDADRVVVESIRVAKKHVRPDPQHNIKGGIADQEQPIHISNLMLVCPNCGRTRVKYKIDGDQKVRACRKCEQTLSSRK